MRLPKKLAAMALVGIMAIFPVAAAHAEEPDFDLQALRYASFAGIIASVEEFEDGQGAFVFVENVDGEITNFVIRDYTCVLSDTGLEPGVSVIGFYDGSAPALMIYPPQYTAEAIVEASPGQSVKYSAFDENYLSADGMLKLNVSEDTRVVYQDGAEFDGDFRGRRVLVVYGASTRSIPEQTAPELIIVLFDRPETAPVENEEPAAAEDISHGISTLFDDDILIRLRTAVDKMELGIEFEWVASERKVLVGDNIVITIGDPHVEMNGVTVTLSSPPQIVNGHTYVLLDFFTNVLVPVISE